MLASPEIDRARGALLGTFVGDALGMPLEGASPAELPERLEMLDARLGRGTYTDDTQMAIALAESLLDRGAVDTRALGRAFTEGLRFTPRLRVGHDRGAEAGALRRPPTRCRALGVRGRGVARERGRDAGRAVAVRYAHDGAALVEAARASAGVTHAHPVAVDAAVAQAAVIGAALNHKPPLAAALEAATTSELEDRLNVAVELLETRPGPAELAAALGNRPTGHQSVPTAIYSAAAHESVEAAVTFAIRCGGDTDTIGAMAGAIAAARDGAGAIPRRWLDALEQGPKGLSHVERLGDRLVIARDL